MIRFANVYKAYPNGALALKDVTFHVSKGEFVFLTGHSGAGKSTIMKLLFAEQKPSAGEVRVSMKCLSRLAAPRQGGWPAGQGRDARPGRDEAQAAQRAYYNDVMPTQTEGRFRSGALQELYLARRIAFARKYTPPHARWPGGPFGPADLPALYCDDGSTLLHAQNREVAQHLGLRTSAAAEEYDAVILGGGGAGRSDLCLPVGLAIGIHFLGTVDQEVKSWRACRRIAAIGSDIV